MIPASSPLERLSRRIAERIYEMHQVKLAWTNTCVFDFGVPIIQDELREVFAAQDQIQQEKKKAEWERAECVENLREAEAALALLRAEKETMIEPLERSDDPEQDIVCRINHAQDYVLCTPKAYERDMQAANAKGRKEVEAQLATLQAALKKAREQCAQIADGFVTAEMGGAAATMAAVIATKIRSADLLASKLQECPNCRAHMLPSEPRCLHCGNVASSDTETR